MSETSGRWDAPEEQDSSTAVALPRVATKHEICHLLRISGGLFDRLIRDGAPYIQRGEKLKTRWQINVADFVRFMVNDAVAKAIGSERNGIKKEGHLSLDEAKRKDKEVQANIRELDLLKLQGELVDVSDVRATLRETFSTVRSRLLAIGTQVVGLTHNQQRDLDDALNDALTDLSSGNIEIVKDNEEALALTQH